MKITDANVYQDYRNGVITGNAVVHYIKKLKEVIYLYDKPTDNLDLEQVVYEVYTYNGSNNNNPQDLLWGLTIINPITIADECNMTRGHFHENRACSEIYFGLAGTGLLMLMSETGETWAENVYEGSIHHIHGKLAHRLINTGTTVFKVGACWSIGSGHDYATIEESGFAYRVFKKNNQLITKMAAY